MSAITDSDWQREVLRLKYGPQQMTSAEIAEAVGKHAATVRKVVARATPEEVREATRVPGQTTVDEQIKGEVWDGAKAHSEGFASEEPPPEDDPEYTETDPLDQFRSEAGEAVGPMPPREPENTEPLVESRLAGTRQTCIDFGPEADLPTGGTLVIKSEKLASGHFRMGDVITGSFTARVTDLGGKERFDKASEEYRAKPTAYVATITELDLD